MTQKPWFKPLIAVLRCHARNTAQKMFSLIHFLCLILSFNHNVTNRRTVMSSILPKCDCFILAKTQIYRQQCKISHISDDIKILFVKKCHFLLKIMFKTQETFLKYVTFMIAINFVSIIKIISKSPINHFHCTIVRGGIT